MFNSLLRQFEDDPFFADPFQLHHDRMRQMMRGFSDPFGQGFMPSITDGRHRAAAQPNASPNVRSDRELDFFSSPFSMMNSMRNRMEAMHSNFENMASDNSHSFSSSSVMTYSKVGDEPPKVFQASSQMRCAPGGIKETRRSLKDSESGLEKMSIGHHIQDRGHVIERKENRKTGEKELNQDFQNMDETEAQSFDEEWQREVSRFHTSAPMARLEAPRHRTVHRAAITGPQDTHRDDKAAAANQTHYNELNIKGSGRKKH
ncbi:myeloid leukemia factor 1 isoform X1 [Labeo rohita]|uniref:Myeloid leukemia factor 1 isoform X1 n=2 Tax=Labeo rohita TaxID=84645 RepID=A0A498M1C2_LABRO|nr:myeloid leukemia factor 1 isoform X1 [Labeo rohita]RXN13276.1 myeloid leukemia factor 1 isoform X1 [Labeo rohita]RXN14397.1 myeloid leukemia factor 1 isoform X1 [Labeo rohita]